jgi:hypothetical protein
MPQQAWSEESVPQRPRSGENLLPLALVLMTTVAALWPVCRAGFVQWDDHAVLYQDPTLNPPTLKSVRIWWTTPHRASNRLYTPIAYMVWGLLAWVARVPPDPATGIALDPHVFHAANLLIHLLTTSVAYFFLKRLIGLRWTAAAGAAVFALHPVQVESVAQASGLQGLLAGLFSLTAVLLYLRSVGEGRMASRAATLVGRGVRTRPLIGTPGSPPLVPEYEPAPPVDGFRPGLYAAATGILVLALLSKPAAMVTPLLAAALQVLWVGGGLREAARRLWPWAIVAAACGVAVWLMQVPPPLDVAIPVYDRPLIAGYSLAFYLYKILLPWRLGIVYARATPPELLRGDAIYYTWLLPAGLAAALLHARRQRPELRPLAVGALWFAVGLLPVLGFTRFDFQILSTVADRYLYLPMFGVALCVASATSLPWCRRRSRTMTFISVALLALAVRSNAQARVWHDTQSLFRNAYRVNPGGGPQQGGD